MVVVPAVCERCGRARLCSVEDAQRGQTECRACSGRCRVLPGCSFAAKDRELFDELSLAVDQARLTGMEALAFESLLHQSIQVANYSRTFDLLTDRMPYLIPARIAIGKNAVAQRRALLMLKTILEGKLGASGDSDSSIPTISGSTA